MNDRENTVELLRRGYDESTRSLSFRVGFYADHEAVCECLRVIDAYNDFDAETVIEALTPLAGEQFGTRVEIGREGSPVLYVHGDGSLLTQLADRLREAHADEVDITGNSLRAWWD